DLDREDVVALLLEESGLATLGDRDLVLAPRFAALFDDADELLVAHVELEARDGGVPREREDVDGLEELRVRVLEDLLDRDLGDAVGDGRRERDGAKRKRETLAEALDEDAAAARAIILRRGRARVVEERQSVDGRGHEESPGEASALSAARKAWTRRSG